MPSVKVFDNDFEKALRKFKKKVDNAGILAEIRSREQYEKPSTIRQRKKAAARARTRRSLKLNTAQKKLY